jgi:hypothetical protein
MADSLADGMTRVAFAGSVANIALPTAAECNAGILLQSVLTADGLMGFEASTAPVPTTSLAAKFDTNTVGRDSFSGTGLRFKKQLTGDTAYTTLVKGVSGFLIVRRDIAESTAWAAGQSVEVYPITCGRRKNLAPEANSVRKYEVPTMITLDPNIDATVA